MAVWLARWLRVWADWLDPVVPDAAPRSPLVARAAVLAALADRSFGPGFGEAKRHQVYSRLIKEYPGVSKRAIARAIEDGLHG